MEHVLHFRGRSRQICQQLPVCFHRHARRRSRVIDENVRPLRDHGLPQIVLRHLSPDTGKIAFETGGTFLVQGHVPPHDFRGHFLRNIAPGRTEPAGRDDEIGAGKRMGKNFFHPFPVVAYRRLEADVNAYFIELPSHIGGVRIDDLP